MANIGDFVRGNLQFNGKSSQNMHYGLVVDKECFKDYYILYIYPMSRRNFPTDLTVPVYSQFFKGNIDFSHEKRADPILKCDKGNSVKHYSRLKLQHLNTIKVFYHGGSVYLDCNSKGRPLVYGRYTNKEVFEPLKRYIKISQKNNWVISL